MTVREQEGPFERVLEELERTEWFLSPLRPAMNEQEVREIWRLGKLPR